MRLPTWLTLPRLALLLVVCGAIALRLTLVGWLPPGLYPDEAANGNDALAALEDGFRWFYPANGGREGLFIGLQAAALWLTGLREPWVLRIVAAVAGILTVPGIYLLGKELWNRRAGLVAAALLAGSFWHVTFSRIGFRAILAPLVLTWALWLLLAGVRRIRARERLGWLMAAFGGALAGLGFHTYIAFRASALVFVAAGLALLASARPAARKRTFAGLALAGACALAVAAPLLHYFYAHPGSFSARAGQVSVLESPHPWRDIGRNVALTAGMLVTEGDRNWRHNDAGQPQLPLVVFLLLVAGAAHAGKELLADRGRDVPGIALLALLAAGALPAVMTNEGMPHALRSIQLLVPVTLLAALGAERAWARLERKGLGKAGMALVVAVCAFQFLQTAARYPAYARKPEVRAEFAKGYLETGRALLRRDLSRPAYVIVPDGDVLIDGVPVAAQTAMFVTGTATREAQERARVFYATSTDGVPPGAAVYDLR